MVIPYVVRLASWHLLWRRSNAVCTNGVEAPPRKPVHGVKPPARERRGLRLSGLRPPRPWVTSTRRSEFGGVASAGAAAAGGTLSYGKLSFQYGGLHS
jgi:hypothetical protein